MNDTKITTNIFVKKTVKVDFFIIPLGVEWVFASK